MPHQSRIWLRFSAKAKVEEMSVRTIIGIDEEKRTGCGLWLPDCAEGALQIVDGKARLVKEIYCDGLGAHPGAGLKVR